MAKFADEELGIIAIIFGLISNGSSRWNENGHMRHGKKETVKERFSTLYIRN